MPPLHPMLVHFPIALWLAGSVWLCVAACGRERLAGSAWVLLAVAAACAIPAALTGQYELARLSGALSETAARHQSLGNLLPWLMGGMVLVKGHFFLRGRAGSGGWEPPIWLWCIFGVAISGIILYTSHLGGAMTYFEGVGYRGGS